MIAAIYARKSNEQSGVSDESKSVARQIEHARVYATRKGWMVADEHVYVDDGISGAEFANRPGFVRLMSALKPKPPFQVLVMSEESRLGREQIEVSYALKQLVTAGVRVFCYLADTERTLDSPIDKLLMSVTAFADEVEREKARSRVSDSMFRHALAGHVTGGRLFGYTNVDVLGPDGKRSHVERQIDEREAAVVRRIFELCAGGYGMKGIAKTLNAEAAPSPRAQQGRSQTWAPTSVREVLHRPVYRGEIVWNTTRKRDRWGQHRQTARPEQDWIRVPAPHLAIVSEDLWRAAHARHQAARALYLRGTNGTAFGRPPVGDPSKYLLTGLAQCGCCGNGLIVSSRSHGQRRALFYSCGAYHQRGPSVCRNARTVPMEDANAIVIEALLDDVVTPDVLEDAVSEALTILQGESTDAHLERIDVERATVERERARLVAAIAAGGELPGLLDALRARETQRTTLETERQAIASQRRLQASETARVRNELLQLARDWRRVLVDDPAQSRPVVTKLLTQRVTFTPLEKRGHWEVRGQGTLANVFGGVIVPRGLASPTGFEPVFQP